MPLPSIGRIDPPAAVHRRCRPSPTYLRNPASDGDAAARDSSRGQSAGRIRYGSAPQKTPAQLILERQLSGAAFSAQSAASKPARGDSAAGDRRYRRIRVN